MAGVKRDDAELGRLSQYLYVADLFAGKRVLEVGCGSGAGARFLANHGAARVVGIDADGASIERARAAHRLSNLDFRVEDPKAIELDDDTFDCICVPNGAELLRRDIVLLELRRLLVSGGYLLFGAPCADRPAAVGGVSYFDLVDRLEPEFAPVRMGAQAPVFAVSLVEYAGEEAPDAEIELDTTLTDADDADVTGYLAVCGGTNHDLRGYAIVQLPSTDGIEALRSVLDPSGTSLETESRLARAAERIAELERAIERRAVEQTSDRPLRRQLEYVLAEKHQLEAEVQGLRRQLDSAQLEIGRVAGETALEMNRVRTDARVMQARMLELEGELATRADSGASSEQIDRALASHAEAMADMEGVVSERDAFIVELREELEVARSARSDAVSKSRLLEVKLDEVKAELGESRSAAATAEGTILRLRNEGAGDGPLTDERVSELEGELEQTITAMEEVQARLDKATTNWREAEAKNDEVWRRVGELQTELENQREKAIAKSAEQRREGKREMAQAMEGSSGKLVGVKNQLLKVETERDALTARSAELETALDEAETARAELEGALAEAEAQLFDAEPTYAAGHAPLPTRGANGGAATDDESALSAAHLAALRAVIASLESEVATQRELLGKIQSGLAELVDVSVAEYDEDSARAKLDEMSMELGIKDAEVTLFDVGVKSLQSRVRDIVDDVTRSRTAMEGHPADEIMRQMDGLVDRLSRLRGPDE
jgi:hypothetical protein